VPGTLSESKQELLAKLLRGRNGVSTRLQPISRRTEGVDIPMSYAQQQIWLHSQLATEVPLYNEPVTIYRYGPLDRVALEKTFTEIIRRHEAWRTTFGWQGNELVQRVQAAPEHIEIPYVDLSAVPLENREEAAHEVAMADAQLPFDLATGPLFRPRLVRFSAEEHRLYLALHHIIFDGLSLYRIFLSELQLLYEAFSHNRPSPLAPLALQYGDFALWQRGWVSEVAPAQLPYWRNRLAGAGQRDSLTTDHPRPAIQTHRGAMVQLGLDAGTSSALKEVSHRLQATPFMTLLATFYILMWVHSREEDLTIGTSSAGRQRPELEGIMGYFLDTVVLRNNLAGDPSFIDVVSRCREELFGALANDGVPFSMLVKELSTGRDGSRNPFFQVMFSLEPPLSPLNSGWKFARMDIHIGSTKFDLNIELDDTPHGLEGRLIYNRDLFERDGIKKLVVDWYLLVARVVADPTRRISELAAGIERVAALAPPASAEASTQSQPNGQQSNGLLGSVRRMFSTKPKA